MKKTLKMYIVVEFSRKDEYTEEVVARYLTTKENIAKEFAERYNFHCYEMKEAICFNEAKRYIDGKTIKEPITYTEKCYLWVKQTTSPIWIEELDDFGKDLWCTATYGFSGGEMRCIPMNEPTEVVLGEIVYSKKASTYLTNEDEISDLMMKYVKKRMLERG